MVRGVSAPGDPVVKDDKDIHFILGEIVGTQKQILKIAEDNAAAIIEEHKRIDAHRAQTLREFEENRQRAIDLDVKITNRYDSNASRINKLEDEILQTKGIMKGVLWVVGLVVPFSAWILKKLEIL